MAVAWASGQGAAIYGQMAALGVVIGDATFAVFAPILATKIV